MLPINDHKYSIILPVKNGGEYVKECVNSILSQTIAGFDLIVLDNSSTDGTADWISQLNDDRIRLYKADRPLSMEENWARITSVDKNEFITIIGHDDLLHADYLETMADLISQHPDASLYQCHFEYIDAQGKFVRNCLPMAEVQYAPEFLACQMEQTMDSMGTGYMMRSKDYDAAGGIFPLYPNLIFADYELWVKLIMKNYKATAASTAFSYRVHNNISRQTNGEAYQRAFGRYMSFLGEIKNKDNKIAAAIEEHGKKMLLYFCESLSHRLLKTAKQDRVTTVGQFIGHCKAYAKQLIPGQTFSPLTKPRILAAWLLDNPVGLPLFRLGKKMFS